jgi:hypothetical protein
MWNHAAPRGSHAELRGGHVEPRGGHVEPRITTQEPCLENAYKGYGAKLWKRKSTRNTPDQPFNNSIVCLTATRQKVIAKLMKWPSAAQYLRVKIQHFNLQCLLYVKVMVRDVQCLTSVLLILALKSS